MNQANRKSVLEHSGTRPLRPSGCQRSTCGARLSKLAIAVAFVAWNCVVAVAAPPANQDRSRRTIRGVGSAPVQRVQAELDVEPDETVPISRVVPKAKTPPGANPVRLLPGDFAKAQIQRADDREMEENTEEATAENNPDEKAVVDEIRSPVWNDLRDREAEPPPARSVRQRPLRTAQREPVTVVEQLAQPQGEIPYVPNEQPPLANQPVDPIDLTSILLAPDQQQYVVDEPWPQDPAAYDLSCPPQGVDDCHCWGPFKNFHYFNQTNGDIGIGHERVMFAPFEIETSQPANNFRLKMNAAYGLQTPDRAEYLWAKIGGPGPMLPESRVDYQNFDAIYEAGGKRFSFVTDIPLHYVHPQNNASGAGIGNISLAPKVVLVSGNDWQITQIFRTYLPTGGTSRGTSNGLVSLEPGVLVRYRWSPRTYVHSQIKYWVPLTGDPIASGNVFNYGLGVSHVLHETDTFAIIPVLEAIGWTVGGGTATLPSGLIESANTTFVNIQPGARFVLGPKGDLGLCEFGIAGGFCTNVTGWYQEQFTVEFRWSW